MLTSALDHLVVAANSLDEGVAFVAEQLGVTFHPGGRHSRMGTHNALLRIGPDTYLEVLAIDPEAPAPQRPRWFGLDRRLPDALPSLVGWVVQTNDIELAARHAPVPLGLVDIMSRDQLQWRITIPVDGNLPWNGAAPTLIQWPDGVHPTARLLESGCALESLTIRHPEADALRAFLAGIGFDGPVTIDLPSMDQPAGLAARFRTPEGPRDLGPIGA